ncbi:MAG: DUF4399 domain-containing protein [Parvibaculaceae bacterium]|nr:DUF4399 domain-containing protein [Parvibaculaceae bacterium]
MRRSFLASVVSGSLLVATVALGGAFISSAQAGETPSAPDAQVYFIGIEDGATITGPVTVVFGLKGMGVAPAGTDKAGTGHHHLLIDTDLPSGEDLDYSLPADENHRHFGGGQTQLDLELAPGSHTLQLLLADQNHIPHNPPVFSDKITITVE